jgi:hypothetical protein
VLFCVAFCHESHHSKTLKNEKFSAGNFDIFPTYQTTKIVIKRVMCALYENQQRCRLCGSLAGKKKFTRQISSYLRLPPAVSRRKKMCGGALRSIIKIGHHFLYRGMGVVENIEK